MEPLIRALFCVCLLAPLTAGADPSSIAREGRPDGRPWVAPPATASSASAPAGQAPRGESAPLQENSVQIEDRKPHSIQVGRFESPWKALEVQERFKALGVNRTEAYRTDSGKVRYRVLLGIFQGLDSAQEFIAKEKLEEAYPLPWTDPAGLRQVEVTVLCRRDDSGPEQQATVILDPSAKEQGRELSLKWACQAPSAAAADGNAGSGIQVAPELLIAPYLSLNSLSAGAGSFSRLGYGLQLGAYRRSGVLGTLAEIEILREGGVKGGGYSRPPHALNASFRAGVVIEPFRGWSLEPMVALDRIPFVSEAGGDDPVFSAYILPVAGMRTRGRLVRFNKGTEIGVELAYLHQFSARYETLTVNSGSDIRIGLGSRSPFSDRSSAEWNLQYRMSSRGTSIIPKQTSGAIHFSLRFRWSP